MIFDWLVINLAVIIVHGAVQENSKTPMNGERIGGIMFMCRQIIYRKKEASSTYSNLAIQACFSQE